MAKSNGNKVKGLTFLHGTPYTFTKFSDKYKGVNTKHSKDDIGFHFTTDREIALTYSRLFELETAELAKMYFGDYPKGFKPFKPAIVYVQLDIKNPLYFEGTINKQVIEKAKRYDYDGIINKKYGNETVVFEVSQIKIIRIEKVFKISKVKSQFKEI